MSADSGQASARRHNLSVVLRLLADGGPRSRAGLADATGLTKATVSKLVVDLAGRGLVRDAEVVQGDAGRPATLVSVAGSAVVALGLVIDVDELRVGAVDLTGALSHLRTTSADNRRTDARVVVRRAADMLLALLAELAADGRHVAGITVAVPGLVADGDVVVAPNLGWTGTPLVRWVQAQLDRAGVDVPVRLDNEANAAARAESRARTEPTFLHVSAGIGVGAGVVLDGALVRGAHGFGGELGHFVVDPDGRRCRCGNRGCLETVVGKAQFLRAAGGGRPATPAATRLARVVERAGAGDDRVHAALADVGAALTTALASAASLFDPEVIVLGGYLTALTPWLAPDIEAHLAQRVLGARYAPCPVQASVVGDHASLLGAGWSALRPVLRDPLLVAHRP